MIYHDSKEIIARRKGNMIVQAVYKGLRLVWQAWQSVSSWFRSDGWFRSEPW